MLHGAVWWHYSRVRTSDRNRLYFGNMDSDTKLSGRMELLTEVLISVRESGSVSQRHTEHKRSLWATGGMVHGHGNGNKRFWHSDSKRFYLL